MVDLQEGLDPGDPVGELADLLPEPSDLLVHLLPESAVAFVHLPLQLQHLTARLAPEIRDLPAERGERQCACREQRADHGDEHRDEQALGPRERFADPSVPPLGARFGRGALHRFALPASIGTLRLRSQRGSGDLCGLGGRFVHGRVLHQYPDVRRLDFFSPGGPNVEKSKRRCPPPDDGNGLERRSPTGTRPEGPQPRKAARARWQGRRLRATPACSKYVFARRRRAVPVRDRRSKPVVSYHEMTPGSFARCAGDAGLKAPTGRTGRRSWRRLPVRDPGAARGGSAGRSRSG